MEFEKLKNIAEVLNVDEEEITMETTFVDDLGADSLDIFQIIMGIEEEFDIEIANEDAEHIVTVSDAVEEIKNAFKLIRDNLMMRHKALVRKARAFVDKSEIAMVELRRHRDFGGFFLLYTRAVGQEKTSEKETRRIMKCQN